MNKLYLIVFLLISITGKIISKEKPEPPLSEIKVYRNFPNKKILTLGYLTLGMNLVCGYVLSKKGIHSQAGKDAFGGFLATGAISLFSFLTQVYYEGKIGKPILIINEKGFWYEGWFGGGTFYPWSDIKHIEWDLRTYPGNIKVWSRSHFFPFSILLCNLDMPDEEIWEKIKIFLAVAQYKKNFKEYKKLLNETESND